MTTRPLTQRTEAALRSLLRYLALRTSASCDEYHARVESTDRDLSLSHPLAMVTYRRLGRSLLDTVRPACELAARALNEDGEHS
jgi:hypothetical protein